MKRVIRILYRGGHTVLPSLDEGQYVKSFDVDAYDGRGHLVTTGKREDALRFGTPAEAMEFYRQVSRVHPLRDDGQPNRPLTAYTVSIEPEEPHA